MTLAVSGNIGVGKSTLAHRLAAHLHADLAEEPFKTNPFLPLSYMNMRRWSLTNQIWFLMAFYQRDTGITHYTNTWVLDRSSYECIVFARAQHTLGHMSREEYELYEELYSALNLERLVPQQFVYITASVDEIIANVRKRGRTYEINMHPGYIDALNREYDRFFNECTKSVVEVKFSALDSIDLSMLV